MIRGILDQLIATSTASPCFWWSSTPTRLDQTLPHEDKLCAVSTDLNTSGNDELLQIRFRE